MLGLFMRQGPVVIERAQRHRSHHGHTAAVYLSFMLCLLGEAVAAPTTCAAFTTACPVNPPPTGQPATTPPGAQPVIASPVMPAATQTAASSAATTQPAVGTIPQLDQAPTAAGSPLEVIQAAPLAPLSPALASRRYTNTRRARLAATGARTQALDAASLPDGIPQRVHPVQNVPRLSHATEQQMYSNLMAVLAGNSSEQVAGQGAPLISDSPPARSSATSSPPADDGLLYLQNARLRVGVDPGRGGSLAHLSSPAMPAEWAGVNLLNTWDSGRLIQQSYYGCRDGSCWVGSSFNRPWMWNPVQGGSYGNAPPKVLSSSSVGGVISTSSIPRNWASQELVDDVAMLTETRLLENVVKVRFTMIYKGNAGHPQRHQEVPAVFVNRRLNVLATYNGTAPWMNQQLSFIMPGQVGEYYTPTEKWAAYVDAKSGFGLGIYVPIAELLVAYRVGPENSTAPHHCSYMAPLIIESIQPGMEISYDLYIALGRVDDMRKWFADIAAASQPHLTAQKAYQLPQLL